MYRQNTNESQEGQWYVVKYDEFSNSGKIHIMMAFRTREYTKFWYVCFGGFRPTRGFFTQ